MFEHVEIGQHLNLNVKDSDVVKLDASARSCVRCHGPLMDIVSDLRDYWRTARNRTLTRARAVCLVGPFLRQN